LSGQKLGWNLVAVHGHVTVSMVLPGYGPDEQAQQVARAMGIAATAVLADGAAAGLFPRRRRQSLPPPAGTVIWKAGQDGLQIVAVGPVNVGLRGPQELWGQALHWVALALLGQGLLPSYGEAHVTWQLAPAAAVGEA
jgi:hypothetical protein